MSDVNTSATTNVGLIRKNNEDAFLELPDQGLWIVADGMGGHAAGEIASSIVIQVVSEHINKGDSLAEAIQKSHESILKAGQSGVGEVGMGSTVVALRSHGKDYEIAWIGDSRAYRWNPDTTPRLEQLSTDHSYVQMLYQSGLIDQNELATHPDKNIITQCLGSVDLGQLDVGTVQKQWRKGDKLVLCSDGLTDCVSDDEIDQIFTTHKDLEDIKSTLIEAALSAGGKDNITVLVAEPSEQITRTGFGRILSIFN